MSKPRLLDLFCGAGGAAMGYSRAGFEVVGIDIKPQPHYPFEFHRADALEYVAEHGAEFDAIHASPPCQRFSTMTKRWHAENDHPDFVEPVRCLIIKLNAPYVIENVPGAPLINPMMLCGSMFGLCADGYQLRRHRIFESSFFMMSPASCAHIGQSLPVYGHAGGTSKRDGLKFPGTDVWRAGMGIDWMTGNELAESIPPAYTQFIGNYLMSTIAENAKSVN